MKRDADRAGKKISQHTVHPRIIKGEDEPILPLDGLLTIRGKKGGGFKFGESIPPFLSLLPSVPTKPMKEMKDVDGDGRKEVGGKEIRHGQDEKEPDSGAEEVKVFHGRKYTERKEGWQGKNAVTSSLLVLLMP